MPEEPRVKVTCKITGKVVEVKTTAKGLPRLPTGWHRDGEGNEVSAEGWKTLYVLRAITIPVSGPENVSWPELREILKTAWGQSTSLSNWAISELSRRDSVRLPGQKKIAKTEHPYLYPDARALFPSVPSQTVVSILNAVDKKYAKLRYDLVWRSAISLPSFRYPIPFPVHNQSWNALRSEEEQRAPLIDVRIGDARVRLRLRSGVEFRRQLAAFDKIVSGDAVKGELALYSRSVSSSSKRNGISSNEAKDGKTMSRVMAKLVAWLPRTPSKNGKNGKVLELKTWKEGLLTATLQGREAPWVLHAEHAQRWIMQQDRRMSNLRDDLKAENRRSPKREQMYARMGAWSAKHTRRLDSLCHEASANVVNFAKRQGCGEILYDDSCREYLPHFPYDKLRQFLAYKADEAGITFTVVTKKADSDPPKDL
jgi:hypothetical protein